jgi:hypothetical protein
MRKKDIPFERKLRPHDDWIVIPRCRTKDSERLQGGVDWTRSARQDHKRPRALTRVQMWSRTPMAILNLAFTRSQDT